MLKQATSITPDCHHNVPQQSLSSELKSWKKPQTNTAWWSVEGCIFRPGLWTESLGRRKKKQKTASIHKNSEMCKIGHLLKTQVNFEHAAQPDSLHIVKHASVWKLWLHTGSTDQKVRIFSPNIHTLILFYNTDILVHTLGFKK